MASFLPVRQVYCRVGLACYRMIASTRREPLVQTESESSSRSHQTQHGEDNAAAALGTHRLSRFLVERWPGWQASTSLSSSECEPFTMEDLLQLADADTKARWQELSLGYPAYSEGSQFLREAISDMLSSGGVRSVGATGSPISASNVNVLAPAEGIFLVMQALLKPGDRVIASMPSYQSLTEVAYSLGCEVEHWVPSLEQNDGLKHGNAALAFRFDLNFLCEKLESDHGKTKLVVLNFPHNPTGAMLTAVEFNKVVALCEDHGCWLFVDEMYAGLEGLARSTSTSALPPACTLSEKAITLGGLSKTFGLPGLRIGWLACRDPEFMDRVAELKDYTTICPAAPSEVLALIALRARDRIVMEQRARCARGLAELREFCCNSEFAENFEWVEPAGGPFAFPRLKFPEWETDLAYCEALLQRSDLNLLAGSLFHWRTDARVRLTFGREGVGTRLDMWADDLRDHGLRS